MTAPDITELRERLVAARVWALSTADEWASELSPMRIGKLYEAGAACDEASTALASLQADNEALRAMVERFAYSGCPDCSGDCSSANPPVMSCIMRDANELLRAFRPKDQQMIKVDELQADKAALIGMIEQADIAAMGAQWVLENKSQAATGCLAEPDWQPRRAHLEGARNAMRDALDYLSEARAALQPKDQSNG